MSNPKCLLQVRGIATLTKILLLVASILVGMETYILREPLIN